MTGSDVVELLAAICRVTSRVWLDGGWGVDALVGEQTRDHSDLDLAVDHLDLPTLGQALAAVGFQHASTATPGLPARYVLRDAGGRQIDCHPLVFDEDGNGWQQLSATGLAWGLYPAEHLRASGTIAGQRVPCISAELQIRLNVGFEWNSKSEHDVRLLSTRCGVAIPPAPWWPR